MRRSVAQGLVCWTMANGGNNADRTLRRAIKIIQFVKIVTWNDFSARHVCRATVAGSEPTPNTVMETCASFQDLRRTIWTQKASLPHDDLALALRFTICDTLPCISTHGRPNWIAFPPTCLRNTSTATCPEGLEFSHPVRYISSPIAINCNFPLAGYVASSVKVQRSTNSPPWQRPTLCDPAQSAGVHHKHHPGNVRFSIVNNLVSGSLYKGGTDPFNILPPAPSCSNQQPGGAGFARIALRSRFDYLSRQ